MTEVTQSVKHRYEPYLDNLKALLIFLVVLGHFLEIGINKSAAARFVFTFIYAFHMPLFVFISGYLSKGGGTPLKLLKNLLIPYLIFNSLWYLLAVSWLPRTDFSWFYPGMSFWYLLSLFIWRVLLPYLTQIRFILPLSILAGVVAGCFTEFGFFLSASRTVFFLPFFLAGYYCSKEQLEQFRIGRINAVLIVVTAGILLYLLPAVWPAFKPGFFYADNAFRIVKIGNWSGMLFRSGFYLLAFVLSVAVLSMTGKGESRLTYIGRNSLYIYIFHTYIVFVFKNSVGKLEEWFVMSAIWLLPLMITPLLATPVMRKLYQLPVKAVNRLLIRAE